MPPRSFYPSIVSRERLPYVERVFKESLRWQPAVPTSLPYWLIEDDVNDGESDICRMVIF